MEATDKNPADPTDCFCDDRSENASTVSSSDFKSTVTSQTYTSELSDLALMRRSGLTVEQIFAQEIYEWRKNQDVELPFNVTVKRASKMPRGKYSDEDVDRTAKRRSTRQFKEQKQQQQQPRYRGASDQGAKSPNTTNLSLMGDLDSNDLLAQYGAYDRISKNTATLNLRRSKSPSPTGSKEESERDPDAKHEKRMLAVGPIIRDVIRLCVVFCISFFICYLPWTFIVQDETPKEIKFPNLTRHNICFWLGSTGILDEDNPCPYRAYLHITNHGNDCLHWSDVHGNSTLVKMIREVAEKTGEKNKKGDTTGEWKAMLALDHLEKFKRDWPLDYDAPYCRRLTPKPPLLYPHCYVYPDDNKQQGKPPVLHNCWAVPCSQKIAIDCYKRLWEAKQKSKKNTSPDK